MSKDHSLKHLEHSGRSQGLQVLNENFKSQLRGLMVRLFGWCASPSADISRTACRGVSEGPTHSGLFDSFDANKL